MSANTQYTWRIAIPSTVTLSSVACAATACYLLVTMGWDPMVGTIAHPEHVARACWLVALALVFDSFDGTVARLARAVSPFGLQLDSLADAMSFGAVPALLVAVAGGGTPWAKLAGLVVLFAAVVRVARYNVEKPATGPSPLYFKGLATPGAGVALATWILLMGALEGGYSPLGLLAADTCQTLASGMRAALPVYAVFISALMVSTRPFADLPKHYMRRVKPWYHLPAVALLAFWLGYEAVLAVFFLGYVLSGFLPASRLTAPQPLPGLDASSAR